MVMKFVPKSLYRIRRELEQEGIFVTPDYLFNTAKRHFRLRVVRETYQREVYGVDDVDAELLKEMVRAAWAKRNRPRSPQSLEKENDATRSKERK